MIYVGMDISSKSFVVHAINDKKRVVFKDAISPTKAGLRKMLDGLGPEQKLVVFEAGNQLKWIALWMKQRTDVQMHVVHPNVVKWISQSSGKTDKVDARKLAQLARGDLLPDKVHIVDGDVRRLRELLAARHTLLRHRVSLITALRGYALQEGKHLPKNFFGRMDWYEALTRMRISSTLRQVASAYRESIEAMKASEQELNAELMSIEDKRLALLESVPGIGQLSSRVVLSAIDDPSRFKDRKAVAKYGALTPTIYQSGDETHMGRINRDGRHEVRRVLLQCAHTVVRMKSPAAAPLREFYEKVQKRRGKKRAIVAVARKLLTVAYGVLKSNECYDPRLLRGDQRRPPTRTYRLRRAGGPPRQRKQADERQPLSHAGTARPAAKLAWQF